MAHVQHNASPFDDVDSFTTLSVTYDVIYQTSGNMNVVAIGWFDVTTTVVSVVDTVGNSYSIASPLIVDDQTTTLSQIIYYAPNISNASKGANTVTVTFSDAAPLASVRISEWSGMMISGLLDGTSGTFDGQIEFTSGAPVVTTHDHDLLYCAGYSAAAFLTLDYLPVNIAVPFQNFDMYDLVYSTGSYVATGTGAAEHVIQLVAFKTSDPFTGTAAINGANSGSLFVHNALSGTGDAHLKVEAALLKDNNFACDCQINAGPASTGFITGGSPGVRYFVTPNGTGTGTGLAPGHTWSLATFNTFNATTEGPGDSVFFLGDNLGHTGHFGGVLPWHGGTSVNVLTLDFRFASIDTGAIQPGSVDDQSYVTFNGGTFATTNTGGGRNNNALFYLLGLNSTNFIIQGWSFVGTDAGDVSFIEEQLGHCQDLLVQNNHLDNLTNLVVGNTTNCNGLTVLNNFVRTNQNKTIPLPIVQSDIVNMGDAANVTIQGNLFWHRTPGNANIPHGDAAHNDCIQCFHGGEGGGGDADPENWIIRYNLIIQDPQGGDFDSSWTMLENMTGTPACSIYGNVFVCLSGNVGNGVTFDNCDPSGVFYFYNNTCIALVGPSNIARYLNEGTLFSENNIIYTVPGYSGTAFDWEMTPGSPFDFNFLFNTLEGINNPFNGEGPHGSYTIDPILAGAFDPNPLQAGNYALLSNSPLLGQGDTLAAPYNLGLAPRATWPNPQLIEQTAPFNPGAFVGSILLIPFTADVQISGANSGVLTVVQPVAFAATCIISGANTGNLTVTTPVPPTPPTPTPEVPGGTLIAQEMYIAIRATHPTVEADLPNPTTPPFMIHGARTDSEIPAELLKIYEQLYEQSEYKYWL